MFITQHGEIKAANEHTQREGREIYPPPYKRKKEPMKFKVLYSHCHNGKLLGKGDVFETRVDMNKIFPGRFLLVEADPETPSPSASKDGEIGVLVDDSFHYDPVKTGLHVYRIRKKYFVYAIDDMETPLNKVPLKRVEVVPFIKAHTF